VGKVIYKTTEAHHRISGAYLQKGIFYKGFKLPAGCGLFTISKKSCISTMHQSLSGANGVDVMTTLSQMHAALCTINKSEHVHQIGIIRLESKLCFKNCPLCFLSSAQKFSILCSLNQDYD